MSGYESINDSGLTPEEQASTAEAVGERNAEKSWTEEMAEVGEFDREKAEKAVETDRRSPEELERKTTDMYEVEILALDKFAESADFLDEPIEEPTETELIRKWQRGMVLHMHVEEVQDWLHSKELSAVDEEYRKELLRGGEVRKERRLFYRPSEGVADAWKNDKRIYVNMARKDRIRDFSREQDFAEQRLERALAEYEPSRETKLSEKGELVRGWIENGVEWRPENADLILDWLESDDGDDAEKRYRALTRAKLSGKFTRFYSTVGGDGLEKRRAVSIPIYHSSHFNERRKFKERLESGEMSKEFAELSDEEREKRWKEAEEAEQQRIIDEEAERARRAAARRAGEMRKSAQSDSNGSSESSHESAGSEGSEEYEGWKESTSLPDQGPDLTDPISPISPFSLFNGPDM